MILLEDQLQQPIFLPKFFGKPWRLCAMEVEVISALQRLYAGDVSASRELEAFQVSPGALELSVKLLSSSVPEAVDLWIIRYDLMSENGVYPQWNSHFWLG